MRISAARFTSWKSNFYHRMNTPHNRRITITAVLSMKSEYRSSTRYRVLCWCLGHLRSGLNVENCWDCNKLVWWLWKVDWDGLDMWNVKMIQTGLNAMEVEGTKLMGLRGSHDGMVLRRIWKDTVSPGMMHSLGESGEGILRGHPANAWKLAVKPMCVCVCVCLGLLL